MSFADIVGQDRAVEFLMGAATRGRVSHAYIFTGPSGVGKKLAALNFAKAVNCLAEETRRPCDACLSCRKADGRNHPDIMVFGPDKDAASLKIDRVRELIGQTSLKAYEGRKKVYIIDDASALTRHAISALLKTLEEPASDSILILIFESLRYVPRTIISRCQVVRFAPISADKVRSFLADSRGMDPARAALIAGISGGRIDEAMRLGDGDAMEKRIAVLDAIARGAALDIDFDGMEPDEIRVSLDTILSWYRDLLITKSVSPGRLPLINTDRTDELVKRAAVTDVETINRAIEDIIRTSSDIDSNANAKLATGVLALKLSKGALCTK